MCDSTLTPTFELSYSLSNRSITITGAHYNLDLSIFPGRETVKRFPGGKHLTNPADPRAAGQLSK